MAGVKMKIGPADQGRTMSLADFIDAVVVSGYGYELGRGVVEVTEVPNDSHGQVVDNLREAISQFRRENPEVIRRVPEGSGVQLVIPEWESERHPDLSVIFLNTPPNERGRRMPRLVIEVVSPGRSARDRDYLTKREEYLTFGIEEYWIVDPELRQVKVNSRSVSGNAWVDRDFRDDEVIESGLLKGFGVRVGSLWARSED